MSTYECILRYFSRRGSAPYRDRSCESSRFDVATRSLGQLQTMNPMLAQDIDGFIEKFHPTDDLRETLLEGLKLSGAEL